MLNPRSEVRYGALGILVSEMKYEARGSSIVVLVYALLGQVLVNCFLHVKTFLALNFVYKLPASRSDLLSNVEQTLSKGHQAEEWMTPNREEITDEEAQFVSELLAEEFAEQLQQLRERCSTMGAMTTVFGAVYKLREQVGEEEYLHNTVRLLGQEGTKALKQFEAKGQAAAIDTAIERLGRAFDLAPEGHTNKRMYSNNLGISHQMRFKRFGKMADIDKAIELTRQAISPGSIHMEDIDKAIELDRKAVDLTPDGHPDKSKYFHNLGSSHQMRFERLGKIVDIIKAIESQWQAVDLTPVGHPNRPMYLNTLGSSHQIRFEHLGEMADISKAVESQYQAVDLTPDGHSNKPIYLNNLGNSYQIRFEHFGGMDDISKAIKSQCQAVDLTPDGHPNKPMYLSNLGNSHVRQFNRLGEIGDIDKAIESQRQAIDLTPDNHPNRPVILANLGTSHIRRFERLGEIEDIDKAIELERMAVDLTPGSHPNKPMYLNSLGISHQMRFERLGKVEDIDKAIELVHRVVDLTPNSHPNKLMYLNNLGRSCQMRFKRLGEMDDISKAIESQCQAVSLTPDGNPDKPMFLNNLGRSHRARFERLSEMADISKAIESQCRAVNLAPNDYPDKPIYLNNIGISHQVRFEHFGDMGDIDIAIANFEQSATSTTGPPNVRFGAARNWISALKLKERIFNIHTQGLRPQHTLINLIPELVWLGAPIRHHFQTIEEVVGSSIHEAVSAAVRAHDLELAVEWMEQGRSIVWSQLRQLRSPLVDLQDAYPFLAQDFQDVQRRIEISWLPRDFGNKTEPAADTLEKQAQAHRRNIRKREDLLTEIRNKKGFESFLRPEKFSVLSKACQGRLTVLLTVSGEHCDALLILPSRSITHLFFQNVSQDVISEMHTLWENSRTSRLKNNLPIQMNTLLELRLRDRGEKAAVVELGPMSSLLADLWDRIVHPIIIMTEKELFDLADDRLPPITWCPSGPLSFLPFHAAGIYGSNSEERISISDYAISSYTPSLMALLSDSTAVQWSRPSILMVTQPSTPGQKPLPGTLCEAEKIMRKAELYEMQPYVHHISQSQATMSAVMEQLKTHGWVHLACHGTQKFPDPIESSFALYDGNLTLESLMQKSMGHVHFAFLSACQTASGDQTIPDEAMHLTSGMLAAGFRSVVGTMWSIEDSVAPEEAEVFYARLFEEGHKSEWKVKPDAAFALHIALKKLREESTGDKDLVRWVPFVHYGI
ncbi:CHAT domain-containing protein [Flagelloscypha sp. PMI_526]|nr:CHAT domain-containing protein [Flagelloscypha sp. PMI_526]